LGGALSTFCAFYEACNDAFNRLFAKHRVVVCSVASPFCGNRKFRHDFQELQRQRRLQHLRIANLEDMVTQAGFLGQALTMIHGAGNLHEHVAIKLQRKKFTSVDGTETVEHSLQYQIGKQSDNDLEFEREVQNAIEAGKSVVRTIFNFCKSDFLSIVKYQSYDERFEICRESLGHKILDDVYNDTNIVGKLFGNNHRLVPLHKSGFITALGVLIVLAITSSQNIDVNTNDEVDD